MTDKSPATSTSNSDTGSLAVHVTMDTFDEEVVNSPIPVVIDFWAPWCAPCRTLSPMLDELAGTWAGQVKVAKVNVDDDPGLGEVFRVNGIPTLVAVQGTKIIGSKVGLSSRTALNDLFEELAAMSAPTDNTSPVSG